MDSASTYHKQRPKNPQENANLCSNMLFCYVLPIFWKGRKKELGEEDLYEALKTHKSNDLGDKLSAAWDSELKQQIEKKKMPSLLRATLKVFGWRIIFLGLILAAIEFLLKLQTPLFLGNLIVFFSKTNQTVSQPLFLGGLIRYYAGTEGNDMTMAYVYAGAVVLCSALTVLSMHTFMLSQLHVGMKIRLAMCSMIYRKALRLSKNALGDTTVGQVVNLLSNDVGRLDLAVLFIHYLWVGPLETVVVTYLMSREVGISSIYGVLFMLAFIPIQAYLGKKTSAWRLKTALCTDERVRMMNEIIQGIQVIKMYAWEKPFGRVIEFARKKELRVIRYVSYIRGILLSFIIFTTRVSIFISLVAYALSGDLLTAEKAFVITAYYNILRQTMTVFFPQGIGQLAETLVSFKRIQNYMLYDETQDLNSILQLDTVTTDLDKIVSSSAQSTISKTDEEIRYIDSTESLVGGKTDNKNHLSEPGVVITNLTAKWDKKANDNTLDNVNIRVQPGTLLAVIGPVGAGKSSLIQAILGELPATSGDIKVNGEVSYASQEPWLFSSTIRQNILFGMPMDKKRYRDVVKHCALEKDFAMFPHGDKTIVGERGQSLSGGQKARISLARACYRQASIYLLDDPLSAVDAHVGRHLFDQCMRLYLSGKTIILVTHQLQYLQNADQIVVLEKGKVKDVGTYDSLKDSGHDFAKLLKNNGDEEEENGDESGTEEKRSRSGSRTRRKSDSSIESLEETMVSQNKQEESRQEGTVSFAVYKNYFKASGGFFSFFWLALFCITTQLAASGGDYFLSFWVKKEETRYQEETMTNVDNSFSNNYPFPANDTGLYQDSADSEGLMTKMFRYFRAQIPGRDVDIYIFTGLTIATIVITLSRSFLFFHLAVRASKNLHNAMYAGVTKASMYFFNTNPSGRILNRFSKDLGQVDEILPSVLIDVIQIFLSLIGIIVVIVVVNYYFIIPTVVIGIIFYFLRTYYLKSSRSIKRMEATTRSPIYSHLGASLSGLSTIRAFGAQPILIREFDSLQDLNSSAFYLFITTSRAFGFWLDVFSVIYIAIVTLSFFLMDGAFGGNVGLAITQAMSMTGMVQWGMRQSAELENTMTAVERVVEYHSVDPEKNLEEKEDKEKDTGKEWPREGKIEFKKLSLRYSPDSNANVILKELNLVIEAKEKIGIVGRTGAGKSSLINALFRLSYLEGKIVIDGKDTHEIPLQTLRKKISIIPQEPVLFSGSMRYNLDPFDEYSDEKIWKALEDVHLKEIVSEMMLGLQSKISEGGTNFSVGQRQLVCLARALLRENKILVMDEATANVDPVTDGLIQKTIREKFADCTVLTIAHRLNTVMDSDRVLVMDAGRAVEFDAPYLLLTKKSEDGPRIFHHMLKETGKGTFDQLSQIAKDKHLSKKNN